MSVPVATLTFGNGVHVEVRVAGETLMGLLDKVKASRANYINASLQWLKPLGKAGVLSGFRLAAPRPGDAPSALPAVRQEEAMPVG